MNKDSRDFFLAQVLVLAATVLVLIMSISMFDTALELFFIGDNIRFHEQTTDWGDDEDHAEYRQLMDERTVVKNSSFVGWLLVSMGSNVVLQFLRIIILLGTFVLDCFLIWLCGLFVQKDFNMLCRKFSKKKY